MKFFRFFVLLIASVACVCLGTMSKYDSKAVDKYSTNKVSDEEKMLYYVSQEAAEANKPSNDFYDEISETVSEYSEYSKQEVKSSMIEGKKERDELEKLAIDSGITVSEEEIDQVIDKTKEALHSDEEGNRQLQAVIAGSGLTEDEYWENCRSYYKKSLLIEKYEDSQTEK